MKRILGSILGLGLLTSLPALAGGVTTQTTETTTKKKAPPPGAHSQAQQQTQQQAIPAPENQRQLTLIVEDVDKDDHIVEFKARIRPEANITENGRPIALDRLEEGDQVRASFDPVTGEVLQLEVIEGKSRESSPHDGRQFE